MKCSKCGQEVPNQIGKTINIKDLDIEVEQDVHDKDVCFDNITIPNKWRLLNVNEVVWLANSKYAKKLKMFSGDDDFYFEQPFKLNKKNNYIARFGTGSDGANLDCGGDPQGSYSVLGVRFCRDLK